MNVVAEPDIQDRWLWVIDEKLLATLSGEGESKGEDAPVVEASPELATLETESAHIEAVQPALVAAAEPEPALPVLEQVLAPVLEEPRPEPVPEVIEPPPPIQEESSPNPVHCEAAAPAESATAAPQRPTADQLFADRQFELALALYRKALEQAPERNSVRYKVGVCLFNIGQYERSREEFEQVIQQDPAAGDAKIGLAWSLLHAGQAEQALGFFEPGDTLGRAQALSMLSRFDEAGIAYKRLLESDPENADVHFHLGYALFKTKQWAPAIESFMNCLARQRNRVEAWIYLGLSQWAAGKNEAAASSLDKALHRDPASVDALRCRTALALASGDTEGASEFEAQLADQGQTLPEFCYNLGVLQESVNRFDEAAQSYRRAVTKKPTYGAALLNLGCLLMYSGKTDEAHDAWRTALSVDPAVLAQ